jgi:hypothetical protein
MHDGHRHHPRPARCLSHCPKLTATYPKENSWKTGRAEKLAEADAEQNYSYTLLSDSKMDASRVFGLTFEVDAATREKYKGCGIDLEAASGESHHLPVPAVYLAGTGGIHSKERLSNEAILEAARATLNLSDPLSRRHVENGRVDCRARTPCRKPVYNTSGRNLRVVLSDVPALSNDFAIHDFDPRPQVGIAEHIVFQ